MANCDYDEPKEPEQEFPLQLYQVDKFLGRGGFGTVHRYCIKSGIQRARNADHVETPDQVAVKLIILTSEEKETNKYLKREISIAKNLGHRNIVRLIGYQNNYQPNSNMVQVNLVMELCQTDLNQVLKIRKQFSPCNAAIIVKQILKGLEYLHNNNIIHRDIKPGNVLCLTDQENPTWNDISVSQLAVKLADFGFARMFEDVGSSVSITMTPCGTPGYWAPEVQKAKENEVPAGSHFSMDSYSVGILTFKLVTGILPTEKEKETLDDVDEKIPQELGDKLCGDDKLVGFLQSTVAQEWRDRHNANKLLEHDFVKEAPDVNVHGSIPRHGLAAAAAPSPVRSPRPRQAMLTQEQLKVDNDLWQAANDGNVDLIKLALDSGADIEFQKWEFLKITNPNEGTYYYKNTTPLIIASARGHLRAVECLISHGSNVDSTEDFNGRTSLMAAAAHGHQEVISVLLDNSANINGLDINNSTALIYASFVGFPSCVRLLLQRGANAAMKDKDRDTAFLLAGYQNPSQKEAVKIIFSEFGINQ